MREAIDRAAELLARAMLAWSTRRLHPSRRAWLAALRAELDVIEGGLPKLVWAMGGLRLVWKEWRSILMRERRYWPTISPGVYLGLILFVLIVSTREVSDDAFPWRPFYLLLFLYLAMAGSQAGRRTMSIAAGARAGAVTAMIAISFALLTFGIHDLRDGVRAAYVLLLFGLAGAACGAGGAVAGALGRWSRR